MHKRMGTTLVLLAVVATAFATRQLPNTHIAEAACASPRPFGDVDSNMKVEIVDAIDMLRDWAGLPMPLAYCGADDVNCDGAITPPDSLDILAYLANARINQGGQCPSVGEVVPHS
jgi:hypothetical protein